MDREAGNLFVQSVCVHDFLKHVAAAEQLDFRVDLLRSHWIVAIHDLRCRLCRNQRIKPLPVYEDRHARRVGWSHERGEADDGHRHDDERSNQKPLPAKQRCDEVAR